MSRLVFTTLISLAMTLASGALAGAADYRGMTPGWPAQANGAYASLMGTLNDGLLAFYNDLKSQGLFNDTMILQFSEFGRRIAENGSAGTDHGAASVMMAMGGSVRGGIYGTAPNLNPNGTNPTLENGNNDVRYETDFRSVYAKVIDSWLGGDSSKVLAGDFKNGPNII